MDSVNGDGFEAAAQRLERLAQLKEKNLLEETEYQDLRSSLLAEMKRAASVSEGKALEQEKLRSYDGAFSVPAGLLHMQIVQWVTSAYNADDTNLKQVANRATAEMAEKRALNPGDARLLDSLADAVFVSLTGTVGDAKAAERLLRQTGKVNVIAAQIQAEETAPVTETIGDISLQNTIRVMEEYPKALLDAEAKNMPLATFWTKWVAKDVLGGFTGGVAGALAFPLFAAFLPATLPIAAAFGAVVGASVLSAEAHKESDTPVSANQS